MSAGTSVSAGFSEAMNAATLTAQTFTLTQAGMPVLATVTYAGTTATLVPAALLASGALYTATITTGATDHLGNAHGGQFRVELHHARRTRHDPADRHRHRPGDTSTGVSANTSVSAAFSELMDAATLTARRPSP